MHTIPLDTVSLQKRKKRGRAVFWNMVEKAKCVKQYVPGMVITILFGLAECFTLPSFFLFSLWFAAAEQKGKALKGCPAGGIGLFLLRLMWGLEAEIGKTIVFLMLACIHRKPIKSRKKLYAFLILVIAACIALGWNGENNAEDAFRQIAGAGLAVCVMPALLRSMELIGHGMEQGAEDDILCLSIPMMIILSGAAHISLFSVNAGLMAAGCMVMLAGWSCGALTGAAAGIGMGFSAVSGGQHVVYLLYMPMAGMLCGCFRDKRRGWVTAVYGGTTVALVYVMMQTLPTSLMINHLAAIALFLIYPAGNMKKWKKKMAQLQWARPKDNEFLRHRMQQWVQDIHQLADVLPVVEWTSSSMEEESEILAESLCDQCDRLPICWHEMYEKTKQGMRAILSCEDIQLPVINRHFDECERLSRIPGILDQIHQQRKEIRDKNRIAAYGRTMMETHLLALSQAAQLISLEGMITDEEEQEWDQLIRAVLEKLHFSGTVSFAKKVDGHMILGIRSDRMTIQQASIRQLIRQIQITLGKNVYPAEQKAGRLILEEIPVYDLLTGQATISAAVQENGSIPANGDAVLVRNLTGGRKLFALSDGMGHGVQARNESKRTLEMLAVCLQAGYDSGQTMRAVNGAMLSATGGESFATLDMGLLDLWTGETRICKLGACSSFVIQGQKISRMTGEALPLGILEHVYPAEKMIKLEDGDRMLMMSDGVADLFDTEDEVIHLIHKYRNDTPQVMAEMILQEAMDRQQYAPADDMTVLCVQLMLRYPIRQHKKSIPA